LKRPDLHPEAEFEIGEALAYYRNDAPAGIADNLDARIDSALVDIARYPTRYPFWERTVARRYVFSRFPYVVFYCERPGNTLILAFAHTSRSPGYWKSRI
jgi:toxin ParE1/3/4